MVQLTQNDPKTCYVSKKSLRVEYDVSDGFGAGGVDEVDGVVDALDDGGVDVLGARVVLDGCSGRPRRPVVVRHKDAEDAPRALVEREEEPPVRELDDVEARVRALESRRSSRAPLQSVARGSLHHFPNLWSGAHERLEHAVVREIERRVREWLFNVGEHYRTVLRPCPPAVGRLLHPRTRRLEALDGGRTKKCIFFGQEERFVLRGPEDATGEDLLPPPRAPAVRGASQEPSPALRARTELVKEDELPAR
mmetsp:Transcript_25136/g.82454  ORF Transcript_25136/g.82454 Transcript_25136/m.82454 type:complete len:251 (+) Transcript_25136:608-1360(+)